MTKKLFNIDVLSYQVHARFSVAHIKVLYIKWPQEEAQVRRLGITVFTGQHTKGKAGKCTLSCAVVSIKPHAH